MLATYAMKTKAGSDYLTAAGHLAAATAKAKAKPRGAKDSHGTETGQVYFADADRQVVKIAYPAQIFGKSPDASSLMPPFSGSRAGLQLSCSLRP